LKQTKTRPAIKGTKWKAAKPMSRCEQYARGVVSGKIVAGEYVIKAAKRFLADLKRTDIYWDEVESMRIINFAERYINLAEDQWEGQPVKIEPWMAFILQQMYGWIRKSDGKRRIRKVFVEVAKKNAKSTLAAIVTLFHLIADKRVKTPNVYVGANSREQALITTNIAGKLINASPKLKALVDSETIKLFAEEEVYKRIVHRGRNGFIKAMAKESGNSESKTSGVKHGINCSLVVVDEYAMADSDSFINTMESAQAARSEPLTFVITTSGYKQSGPCFQKLRKGGMEILDGIIENDSTLSFIYEPDENDDIYNPKTWQKSNPNLGISVQVEFLKAQLREAKNEGGSKEVDVKIYNFNMWVDSPVVWISSETWKMNNRGTKEKDLEGRLCYGGLEIVSGLDLNAFSLYFPKIGKVTIVDKESGKKKEADLDAVKPFFWMAKGKVIHNKMKVDCSKWVERGFIKTTDGDVIDNEIIYAWILESLKDYNMDSLAYNVNLQHHEILQGLDKARVTCNPISQGYRGVSEPSLAWEEMLTAGRIEHFNNPVFQWMNSNCFIIRKENDIRVQRQNGRVAGISATINAMAQYKTVEAEPKQDDQLIESW